MTIATRLGRTAMAGLLLAALSAAASASQPLPAVGTVQALFSPWDDAEGGLIDAIKGARHSIHVQAFVFTSRNIAKALIGAKQRGVKVEVLADSMQAINNEHSQVKALHEAGIPVRFEVRYANAHNKIMLIDAEDKKPVVITGSYNYTYSAQARNAENLLILQGNRKLAGHYLNNWRRHQAEALSYDEVIRP